MHKMNVIEVIKTEYLRGSRTIETILVSNNESDKLFLVYNYEGISFRVFEYLMDLVSFFQGRIESDYHFSTEDQLDDFLLEFPI